MLQHVPQRQKALAGLVAALKPRGWLVIEEFDGRLIDRAIPMADALEAERFKKMGRAVGRLLDDRGYEADWPRRLYGCLKATGLTEVGMEGHLAVREGEALGRASMPRTTRKCARKPSPKSLSRTPRSTPCWRAWTRRTLRSSRR